MTRTWDDYDYVTCGCCGALVEDTPEGNVDHETRGHDVGFGMCVQCAEWSFDLTMKPIFAKVRAALNEKNRAKWDGMHDGQKAHIVEKMLDEGVLSWKIGG
jgi:hypothetical protein